MNKKQLNIAVVGAGLAGTEASLVLARLHDQFAQKFGIDLTVHLFEMRDKVRTAVHKTNKCSELVCSNSLKSLKCASAAGMLKYELAKLASPTLSIALECKVDAGGALAVDREVFSRTMTALVQENEYIKYKNEEINSIDFLSDNFDYVILATGPLTTSKLANQLSSITGSDNLAFYDAAAPIVMADSLDMDKVFSQNRYSDNAGDYLNAPMEKEEYESFIHELLQAQRVIDKAISSKELFQACQPIEEVAKTGIDSLRFGALKPVGITNPQTGKRPWAVVQLRAENKNKTAYNLVGFQTNLKFSEQKRVFGLIPGLSNAEFARYGVMHRNTFLNAPTLLDSNMKLKQTKNIFVAGQLSGTEGYVEAIASGNYCAISLMQYILGSETIIPENSAFGSLIHYATDPSTKNYQPMHVNFGILPPLQNPERNKKLRYKKYAERGAIAIDEYVSKLDAQGLITVEAKELSETILCRLNKIML